jgi:hypothetical protein
MTWGTWLPDPFFRLKIKNMHRAKHGSDSEVYTKIGEYDDERFNYIFKMYTAEPHTHMTLSEAMHMVHCNMDPCDPVRQFLASAPSFLVLTDSLTPMSFNCSLVWLVLRIL